MSVALAVVTVSRADLKEDASPGSHSCFAAERRLGSSSENTHRDVHDMMFLFRCSSLQLMIPEAGRRVLRFTHRQPKTISL